LQNRRHRLQAGRLLLEGVRLINDAIQSGILPELVFFVPDSVQTNQPALRLLDQLQMAGVECLACAAALFATLSETVTPQGLAAVMPLPNLPTPPQPNFTLLLDQVRDPGNAGTLLRSAEAAGVDLVLFGAETVDPFNDKVVRAGMGAHFRLPLRICADWPAVQRWLAPEQQLYLAQADASLAYDQVDWRLPVVLVVGGEAEGASPPARSHAQPIAIPMQGKVESLNAGIAGAIILFEAARQRRQATSALH
ncbi:MAG: RNA methyltransferase, partial [Chloroflexi bacterium]|nr:RNA methyltransferase [Chloroflexota bacterium]